MDDEQFTALAGSMIIGIGRVYDVLLAMYSHDHPEESKRLLERHKEGKLFFPPPSIFLGEPDES